LSTRKKTKVRLEVLIEQKTCRYLYPKSRQSMF
jgi:hypothetical protein